MYLERLELTDFRNYETLRLDCERRLGILVGQNAQGKTNVLEAVLLLALGRSPRTSRDSELVRWGCQSAVVRGEVRRAAREPVIVSVGLRADGSKQVKVDGEPRRRLADAVGEINVVLFGPEGLKLVSGGPGERRAYLNGCLGQTSRAYLDALAAYKGILRQRNGLLRQAQHRPIDVELLGAYDDQFAAAAASLMVHRGAQVKLLADEAARVHEGLSGGREALAVTYQPSVRCPLDSESEVTQAVGEKLIARRDEALRRGVTTLGPHRDDLEVSLDGREARTFGSQGQQRTAALALKIAELRVVAEAIGEPPLLLLDDVLSELDPLRRAAVMALVDEADQVLVTCADAELFDSALRSEAQIWQVRGGTMVPWAEAE